MWVFIVCQRNTIEKVKVFRDFEAGRKYADDFIKNINIHLKNFPDYRNNEKYKDGVLSVGLYAETEKE